jgi:hypothetical protein
MQTKPESKLDSTKRSALATEKSEYKIGLLCLDVETGWALASKLNKNLSHPGVNRPSPSSTILRV